MENHSVLRALCDGYLQEINRNEEAKRRCSTENAKHDYYKKTRCTSVAEEEQSATPWGVKNVCIDSDDEDGYSGEQAEIQAESDELRAARSQINPAGWDTHLDALANWRKLTEYRPAQTNGCCRQCFLLGAGQKNLSQSG